MVSHNIHEYLRQLVLDCPQSMSEVVSSCFVKESVIRIRAIVILVRVDDMEGGGD